MAEVLGIVASTVALAQTAQGLAEGIRLVTELYNAPREITALQDQVQIFQGLLRAAEVASQGNGNHVLHRTVSRAQTIVDELHQVISVKLLTQGGSNRARRRAWFRHKPKITSLKNKLREAREDILVALSTDILVTAHGVSSTAVSIDHRLALLQTQSARLALPERTRAPTSGGESPKNSTKAVLQPAPPTSAFETMTSFRPATYTNRFPLTLLCYDALQVQASEFHRTNYCTLYFSPAPSRWLRLTIMITNSVNSPFWDLWRVKSKSLDANRHFRDLLPAPLVVGLTSRLQTLQSLQQDSELSAYLGAGSDISSITLNNTPASEFKARLRHITNLVYHLGCRRHVESELNREYLANGYFMTFLDHQWMLEFRFRSDISQTAPDLYELELLHCCQGCPGISPFGGVILDGPGPEALITSFLVGLPAKGKLTDILYTAAKSGQPVSWKRRARWCRQIVQAVSEVHRRGKVVGTLGGVGIDGHDNAVLFRFFSKTFRPRSKSMATVPPECHHLVDGPPVTVQPQTDLYQLGLRLWCLSANRSHCSSAAFCAMFGCTTETGTVCTEPHASLVQLPPLGDGVPQYLKDVIAACRSENPDDRKAAHELLGMFPGDETADHSESPQHESGSEYLTRPEECWDIYGKKVNCDVCGKRTSKHLFQCDICHMGDFGICPACFVQGAHCLDGKHYLRELEYRDAQRVAGERYYRSANEGGQRDVINL